MSNQPSTKLSTLELNQISLFLLLPEAELQRLADTLRPFEVPPQSVLVREGERGDHFYIILSGEVEVVQGMGTADEWVISTRVGPDYVGEMSLLSKDHHRTASLRTLTSVRLLEMTRSDFDELLQREPTFVYDMVHTLSGRLAIANASAMNVLREKNRQLTQSYEDLKAAHVQIVKKEILERELRLAYEIQVGLLPATPPLVDNYRLGARMQPARSVGGDFFDFVRLDANRLGIAIGDVSDKGVPAAIFMAQAHALLHAEASVGRAPVDVLQRVNHYLLDMNTAGQFVTAIYGVLNLSTGEFNYARAGHDLPLLCDGQGNLLPVPQQKGLPLGMFDDPTIDEQTFFLPPNGCLLLYTDGVIDACDPLRRSFGLDRLQTTVKLSVQWANRGDTPLQFDLCDELLRELVAFQSEAPQEDDITMVAVHAS